MDLGGLEVGKIWNELEEEKSYIEYIAWKKSIFNLKKIRNDYGFELFK